MLTKTQSTMVGVWLDGREATLVWLRGSIFGEQASGDQTVISHLLAKSQREHQPPTRWGRGRGRSDRVSESRARARWRRELTELVEQVAVALEQADIIYVLGPGRAKWELSEQLSDRGLDGCIVGIDAVGRLSERQLIARVRKVFEKGQLGRENVEPGSRGSKTAVRDERYRDRPQLGDRMQRRRKRRESKQVERSRARQDEQLRDHRPRGLSAKQDIEAWLA
jgi:hypothetical protein